MSEAHDEIRGAGGDVVAVFQYRAGSAANFCRKREATMDCLGDPEREAYRAVGLERGGMGEVMAGPKAIGGMLKAARKGHIPHWQGGDVRQMPGTFVGGRDGRVALAHYNEDSSDNPPIGAVLEAVRAAA